MLSWLVAERKMEGSDEWRKGKARVPWCYLISKYSLGAYYVPEN